MSEVDILVGECEEYIDKKGIDDGVVKAYCGIAHLAHNEKEIDKMLKVSKRAKELVQKKIFADTGSYITGIEEVTFKNNIEYKPIDDFYDMLLLEARYRFESFMLYMERKRPPEERFYLPRINPLRQVAQVIQDLYDDKLDEAMVFMPGRVGKAEPLDALVLTPDGFKYMGDIKVGDKVISGNGKACNVTGVFPQGEKEVYRVSFTDGTSAECCKEHLWRVQTINDRTKRKRNGYTERYRVVETQEMMKKLKSSRGDSIYSVDYVMPVEFSKKELKIDPYVLGVLLGDGCLSSGECTICNPESDVMDKVKDLLKGCAEVGVYDYKDKCVRYPIKGKKITEYLKHYNLLGKRSFEKYIPKEYLNSDVTDRVKLLQGLCDTDGSVKCGSTFVEYCTSSEQLANDVRYLVLSLGGRATMKKSHSHYTKNGQRVMCRDRYRVLISMPNGIVPVSSKKNLAKYKDNKRTTKKYIKSIEYTRKAPCQCIMVDDPSHLYVTNDFIVTHNTQIVKMGNLWFGSNRPERSNLYSAYSDKITGGFYDGILEMITDPTYTYGEIYPENLQKKLITDGKDLTIDILRKKTYPTFTMRSIYGTLNGACDCDGLGVYDDLFSGIDEALSEDRQNTVWGKFDNNFIPRIKPGKAKLMGIGTRWAVRDVQGRRLELLNTDPEYAAIRHREIIIPAMNENNESNFDYPYKVGFTTVDYKRRMASFEANDDLASWLAQYQQEPIVRQGQMFNVDTMNFFDPREIEGIRPDRIFAAVDPAYGGGDYVSMPICYEINGEHYVVDAVYNDGEKDITIPEVCGRIETHLDKFKNKTAEVHFEESKSTSGYRTECEKIWEEDVYPVMTSHDPADNKTAKMDRIKNHAPEIRKLHFVNIKQQSKEYRKYFQNIISCTYEGKMKHDDGIDSTAQLCDMIYVQKKKKRKTRVISSPL